MSFANVEALDKHMATRSYVTGYALSEDDKKAFLALKAFPARASTPNAYRWALHISALTGLQLAGGAPSSASAAAAPAAKGKPAAAKKADDDDMDLFGDDDVNSDGENAEEAAATKARRERMEAARKLKEEADAKKGLVKKDKEKPAEKSLIVLDVKPWEADTDLKMVWGKIIEYKQDGLRWGDTFKLEPVAYGIMKLVMTVTIEDAKVLLDDITDHIEGLEEWVQSVSVASMNKV